MKLPGASQMINQYLEIKDQNPGCLLFFRLGDFYELFFDDAVTASKELDLVLTGKQCGLPERAPMCGIPYHAADSYIAKLIDRGYKVAVCEQMEIPKKGLAKREIVRVVTPGTVTDGEMLAPGKNNYLLSVCLEGNKAGVCWADISTGEFNRATIDAQVPLRLNDLLARIAPSEIICNADMKKESANLSLVKYGGVCEFQLFDATYFDLASAEKIIKEMCKASAEILLEDDVCKKACGALLIYVRQTQKLPLRYIRTAENNEKVMTLDSNAMRTLEILKCADGKERGSVASAIDMTKTGMGSRLIKKWLSAPSNDEKIINIRLNGVEELVNNGILRGELRNCLSDVFDIERLGTRLSYGDIKPRSCLSLAKSLSNLPKIKELLSSCTSDILKGLGRSIDPLTDVAATLTAAISQDAPVRSSDGGIFNSGYNAELDSYRDISANSKTILAQIEAQQKEETGIKNLRVGYNGVFGYFIEVPKSQVDKVPYYYVRKQTTVNSERYITEELKTVEDKILHADERALTLEQDLYKSLIDALSKQSERVINTATAIAQADVLASNAEVAAKYNYTKPVIGELVEAIDIKEGRHLIVERMNGISFVPNDTFLNGGDSRIMIITGPNMAGKSIYMRQVAIIVILMGCFVPASSARISIVDKLFTRVGASDDLHTGRSTFMVEMSEVSYILGNATDKSLVLLDEVGRGTATYDGLSIAWAVIEYLANNYKANVMFSTHYHELTDLEGVLDGVKNYKIAVKELSDGIVFLHKMLRGSANRSFGIEVAGLSGLPAPVLTRAKELLKQLEKLNIARQQSSAYQQVSMFNTDVSNEIVKILRELDPDDISPRAAYDILMDLKEKAEVDK